MSAGSVEEWAQKAAALRRECRCVDLNQNRSVQDSLQALFNRIDSNCDGLKPRQGKRHYAAQAMTSRRRGKSPVSHWLFGRAASLMMQ